MPAPLALYYPDGKKIDEFGTPIFKGGESRNWTGEWTITQDQLDAGKITFMISYSFYSDNGVDLIKKGKRFSKKIVYSSSDSNQSDQNGNNMESKDLETESDVKQTIDIAESMLSAMDNRSPKYIAVSEKLAELKELVEKDADYQDIISAMERLTMAMGGYLLVKL